MHFEDGHWWVYNADGRKMSEHGIFVLVRRVWSVRWRNPVGGSTQEYKLILEFDKQESALSKFDVVEPDSKW